MTTWPSAVASIIFEELPIRANTRFPFAMSPSVLRGRSACCLRYSTARRTACNDTPASRSRRPGYFLEPRRSCSRGFRFLILCRDARRSRRVRGGAVPFARIACGGERASPTATGGCEEPVAAQASDVHGLAAVDDRAVGEGGRPRG